MAIDPITGMVVISTLSSLAQAYQQHQAIGASQDELDKIKKSYDDIKPPEFPDITAPPELIAETAPVVDYDMTKITPEQFKVIGEYAPEIAPYIAEQKPELVRDTAVGEEGVQAQLAALRRFQGIAEGGIDPQFAQRMAEAERQAQIAAQSRQESILQDYQRRGLLGSGTQLAAELAGAEGAMGRAAQQSADAATQAYLNQLGALRESAGLGGAIRGQELDVAARNAAIANAFNQRTTRAYQNYLQQAAADRNQAALRNLAQAQQTADLNVEQANRFRAQERDRIDRILEAQRGQRVGNIAAENLARQQNWENLVRKAQIESGQETGRFGAQESLAGGRARVGGMESDLAQRRAQATAGAIQGLGEGAIGGIVESERGRRDDESIERQKRRDEAIFGVKY